VTSAAISRFNTVRLAELYAARGETITFRGASLTAIISPAQHEWAMLEGGVERKIDSVCRIRVADLTEAPRRWEAVTLADGRSLVVGNVTPDTTAREYIMRLVQPGGAA
jgi:hypothetical protein